MPRGGRVSFITRSAARSDADGLEQDMAEHTAPYRILVVEDDPDCSDLVVRIALKSGYVGLVAADPLSIDEAIRNWRPHVITLDLCLPEIDGMEVISLIRAVGFAGELIIISGQAEWIRELTASITSDSGLSVPAHMSKPVDLRRLHDLLTHIRATVARQSLLDGMLGRDADIKAPLAAKIVANHCS
jgi:CheY-like chemotaxis protein